VQVVLSTIIIAVVAILALLVKHVEQLANKHYALFNYKFLTNHTW
jgi:hypothetical protein